MKRALLVALLMGCSTKQSSDAGIVLGAGETLYLDATKAYEFHSWNWWSGAYMLVLEDGGWDLHCNDHCRFTSDGGVIEVRW